MTQGKLSRTQQARCLQRLLEFEKGFLKDIAELWSKYEQPLRLDGAAVLDTHSRDKLFVGLADLERSSQALVESLEKEGAEHIGRTMMSEIGAGGLDAIRDYARSYAREALPVLERAPDLGRWLSRTNCSTTDLRRRLGKPLSRLSAWRIILTLALSPHEGDEDRSYLMCFLAMCTETVTELTNEFVGDATKKSFSLAVGKMKGAEVELPPKPRQVLHQGDLMKAYSRGRHVRHFVLLTDCLVYGVPGKEGLRWKRNIPVAEIAEVKILDFSLVRNDWPYGFRLDRRGRQPSFLLYTQTQEERDHWMSLLDFALGRGDDYSRSPSGRPPSGTLLNAADSTDRCIGEDESHDEIAQTTPAPRLVVPASPSVGHSSAPPGPTLATAARLASVPALATESDTSSHQQVVTGNTTADVRSLLATSDGGTPLGARGAVPLPDFSTASPPPSPGPTHPLSSPGRGGTSAGGPTPGAAPAAASQNPSQGLAIREMSAPRAASASAGVRTSGTTSPVDSPHQRAGTVPGIPSLPSGRLVQRPPPEDSLRLPPASFVEWAQTPVQTVVQAVGEGSRREGGDAMPWEQHAASSRTSSAPHSVALAPEGAAQQWPGAPEGSRDVPCWAEAPLVPQQRAASLPGPGGHISGVDVDSSDSDVSRPHSRTAAAAQLPLPDDDYPAFVATTSTVAGTVVNVNPTHLDPSKKAQEEAPATHFLNASRSPTWLVPAPIAAPGSRRASLSKHSRSASADIVRRSNAAQGGDDEFFASTYSALNKTAKPLSVSVSDLDDRGLLFSPAVASDIGSTPTFSVTQTLRPPPAAEEQEANSASAREKGVADRTT
eukprot:Hpha_TRINITY_DN4842_c0_g1::TRINITY_DN4842_c0_g1_i1::g.20268::m.20268